MEKSPSTISVRAFHADSRGTLSLPDVINYHFSPCPKVERFLGEFEGAFFKTPPQYNYNKSFSIYSRTIAEIAPVRIPAYSSG